MKVLYGFEEWETYKPKCPFPSHVNVAQAQYPGPMSAYTGSEWPHKSMFAHHTQ